MPLLEYWQNLADRDRKILLIATPVIILLLFYALLIDPWKRQIKIENQRMQTYQENVDWMQQASQEIKTIQAQQANQQNKAPQQSPLTLVDRIARAKRINNNITRVEPQGKDSVRVSIDEIEFDKFIDWIETLQRNYNIVIETASIIKKPKPGIIQTRITLTLIQ